MKILVLNAGSSSQKCRLYELADGLPDLPPSPLWSADADWSERHGISELKIKTAGGQEQNEDLHTDNREEVIKYLLDSVWSGPTQVIASPAEIDIVGHRVVHGGQEYRESVLITPAVKDGIARMAVFAPAHNPRDLEGIAAIEHLMPQVTQVAIFDTAFHSDLPLPAAIYPLPYEWYEQEGIRRYGFHGISHQYCTQRAAQLLGRNLQSLRLITCHLGNGCSLAAVQHGRSVDTTMGMTTLEGLMMGTRSGTVDPGVLIYLMEYKGYTAEKLDTALNKASGLQGVSGISGDMRQILKSISEGNARAQLAYDIYVHRLRSGIGAMLATLGGVDALVFAGGVGEHAASIRAAACETFAFLGLQLDDAKNAQSPADQDIATAGSTVRVLVIQTQEDWNIAQECWKVAQTLTPYE